MKTLKTTLLLLAAAAIFAFAGCSSQTCPTAPAKGYCSPKAMTLNKDSEAKLAALSPNFAKVLEFMKSKDISKLANGKYEIDGTNSYIIVSDNDLRTIENAPLEAHREYIDLQYLISGKERIGVKNSADCKSVKTPYKPKDDIMFFSDSYTKFVDLNPGEFTVLTPSDAHAPLIGKGKVRKAVFKVKK